MLEKMPGYYRKSKVMTELCKSIENEFERLKQETILTENQFFVILSDRNIKNHEEDVGLVPDASADIETRRGRVLSKLRGTGTVTKTMMKKHNVHQLTKTALLEVKDSSFLVRGDGEPYELPFEYGFVCLGMRAQGQLYQNLTEEFSSEDVEIMNIGDSQRARRIIDGTQEGRNILTILEQRGYL